MFLLIMCLITIFVSVISFRRISLKDRIEGEPKAQREENKRRAEKIIEDIIEEKEMANQKN